MTTAEVAFNLAKTLGQCAADALADTAAAAPDRVCLLVAGEIAADACDCGQLAVTITRMYPSNRFPAEAADDSEQPACGSAYLAIELKFQILRCAVVPDENGVPPSCEDLEADARVWIDDAFAVRRGVGCCLRDLLDDNRIEAYLLRGTTPVGPLGGCVGSEVTAVIGVTHCLCPPGS